MHASALDRLDVNEHIWAAVVLHDETKALLGVEKLNGTCGHHGLLIKREKRHCPTQTIRTGSHIRILRVLGEKAFGPKLQGQA